MNIIEFINYITTYLVGFDVLYDLTELEGFIRGIENWTQIFYPSCICSVIAYIGIFVFVWQVCFVLPYRFFKRLIRYPSRKGSEF